jgi:hypothetical protein
MLSKRIKEGLKIKIFCIFWSVLLIEGIRCKEEKSDESKRRAVSHDVDTDRARNEKKKRPYHDPTHVLPLQSARKRHSLHNAISKVPNNNHKAQLALSPQDFPLDSFITTTQRDFVQHKRATLPSPTLAKVEAIWRTFIDTQHPAAFAGAIYFEVCFDGWTGVDIGWNSGAERAARPG